MTFKLVLKHKIKNFLVKLFSVHRPAEKPDIFIFSTPRSGSTWLMELIMSQPGFRYCDEPFNIRTYPIFKQLGTREWSDIYKIDALENIKNYIQSFINGSRPCHARIKHSLPFGKNYRPKTLRIVFKILHACEDNINWFEQSFNGKIIFMMRHPIPVSLSRKTLPRQSTFLDSDYSRHFSKAQMDFGKSIYKDGTQLEKAIVSWCFQNMVPLRDKTKDWILITYEQLVLDPSPIIALMALELNLPFPQKMLDRIGVPSETTWQSEERTKKVLSSILDKSQKKYLIEKWKSKISEKDEKSLMSILDVFNINVYSAGNTLPSDKYWIRT